MFERERILPDKAAHAIADVVMVMQYVYLKDALGSIQTTPNHSSFPNNNRLETLLAHTSQSQCFRASIFSLDILVRKYPDLFKRFIILTSSNKDQDQKFKQDPLWDFHSYFLVEDKKGRWFASSPANHRDEDSPLLTVLSGTLNNVLNQIKESDNPLLWPNAEDFQNLVNTHYQNPITTKQICKKIAKDILYTTTLFFKNGLLDIDYIDYDLFWPRNILSEPQSKNNRSYHPHVK